MERELGQGAFGGDFERHRRRLSAWCEEQEVAGRFLRLPRAFESLNPYYVPKASPDDDDSGLTRSHASADLGSMFGHPRDSA